MGVYGRIFAAGYEHWTRAAEKAGLRDERRRLLTGVHGSVLEIGPGPGLNFPYYPDAVTELFTRPGNALTEETQLSVLNRNRGVRTNAAGTAD